jgi:CheY-like chemotaxis protein
MKHFKILWIDDMTNWSQSAQLRLEKMIGNIKCELHIVHRANGENIVQELMQYDFDLILMDYHMDPFNGDKYIKDIRQEEHLEHIPIIFYTQDASVNLAELVSNLSNVRTVYRSEIFDYLQTHIFSKLALQ